MAPALYILFLFMEVGSWSIRKNGTLTCPDLKPDGFRPTEDRLGNFERPLNKNLFWVLIISHQHRPHGKFPARTNLSRRELNDGFSGGRRKQCHILFPFGF